MAVTYEPISTLTLGSTQGTITFSSIPQTYTDLVFVMSTNGNADYGFLTFNGSSTGYSDTAFYQIDGNDTNTTRDSNATRIWVTANMGGAGDRPSTTTIDINNYSNTTTHKTLISRVSNGYNIRSGAIVGTWQNTAAITSLTITYGPSYASGSTFTLYGIKAA